MNIQKSETHVEANFADMQIDPRILQVLTREKFITPTPIQSQSIPVAIGGSDVIGIAQTGTGKTLAFAIPAIQKLLKFPGTQGLVVVPTRELAIQVEETFQKIGRSFQLRTALIIGGAAMGRQIQMLKQKPHVIIGTPGRILDHLKNKRLDFSHTKMLVLDEADRMFDMGFAPQIKQILENVPKERHTMLFSATMPDDIAKIATEHMKLPVRVEIARAGTVSTQVEQELILVDKTQKNQVLAKLLAEYKGTIIIFSRTKHGATKICRDLKFSGHDVAEIHSNKSLFQRKEALAGFKNGKYRILVATDIAARGIDVDNIELVVNYDMPECAEDYVHRIGRTGRAGLSGRAVTFVMSDQHAKVRNIERLTRSTLSLSKPTGEKVNLPQGRSEVKVQPQRRFAKPSGKSWSRGPAKAGNKSRNRNFSRPNTKKVLA